MPKWQDVWHKIINKSSKRIHILCFTLALPQQKWNFSPQFSSYLLSMTVSTDIVFWDHLSPSICTTRSPTIPVITYEFLENRNEMLLMSFHKTNSDGFLSCRYLRCLFKWHQFLNNIHLLIFNVSYLSSHLCACEHRIWFIFWPKC